MTPMKDNMKVKVTGAVDAVTRTTVEDNHVSLIIENTENVIKIETDIFNDYVWNSTIEISKDVANDNNVKLPLESQGVPVNNIDLNPKDTNYKLFYCKYCGKQFKFRFGLNKHIQKCHNHTHECKFCKLTIDKSKYNEHVKNHEKDETRIDITPNIKSRKLNDVWKSEINEFKCNICFQKCHSEKNLVEHMEIHDNDSIQCNDCLKYVLISKLNNHMQELHNKHFFKCKKCNLLFEKEKYLNCHLMLCLKSSYTKFKPNSTTCSACGIAFNSYLSLKNHMTIGCEHYTCKYCEQFFNSRILWLRHVSVHEKDEQYVMLTVNNDKTTTTREHNQTEVVNDSSFNTNKGQLLSTNVTGRNSLDQTDLVSSNTTIVSTVSNNSITNSCVVLNSNQEKNLCIINRETNSSDQMNLKNNNESIISTVSHNSIVNNCHMLNIKEEKSISTNVRERNSFDQMDLVNSDEPTIANKPLDLMASPNPTSIDSNSVASIVRETLYFCIKKLPNIKNVSCNDNYEQTSHVNVIFLCRICKKSPFSNIHLFALHMSDHRECNMHECIVCDKTFKTVSLWVNHMIVHQQQLDLNVSTVQCSPIKTEPHTLGSIKVENMESQICTTSKNRKFISSSHGSYSDKTSLNNSDKKKIYRYDCSICKKLFPSKVALEAHQTLHNKPQSFSCKYCKRIFSKKAYCTNHEKSHIKNEYKNKLSAPTDIDLNNCINLRNKKKCTVCTICNKQFASVGSLSNHMYIHLDHKSYECQYCNKKYIKKAYYMKHVKKHVFQNGILSASKLEINNTTVEDNEVPKIENCDDFELVHNPVDGYLNDTNLTNIKLFTCDVCEEKFSCPSQLNQHRTLHSGIVPYVCKICNRSFPFKFRWNLHLKEHYKNNIKNLQNKLHTNNQNSNIGKQKIESFHNQDTMKCQYCKKEFNSISQLKNHLGRTEECRRHCKINFPELPSNQASENFTKSCRSQCNICKKTFSTSYNRFVHLRNVHKILDTTVLNIDNHTSFQKDKVMEIVQNPVTKEQNRDDRKKCKFCDKLYSNKGNLSRHISMVHTNRYEQITCHICLMTFKNKFSYIPHLKMKHNDYFKMMN
ncbi:zinc finger protein 60-like [Melanaphis sacchari]|nr:zinc finger protein 60-like [Melanaphis sacchari]